MYTETNLGQGQKGDEPVNRLCKEWANVWRLKKDGVLIADFTW